MTNKGQFDCFPDIFGQQITNDIWGDKYRYGPEADPQASMGRVAKAIYANDTEEHRGKGLNTMLSGLWMPGGRIHAGAGTSKRVTMMNCYVDRTIQDSMEGIAAALKDAMLTMQQGGGIGMDFSPLRPSGAILRRTGAVASGPLPFMEMWDSMCATIMSAGARRGAMMSTLHCEHPDLIKYIEAKQTAGVMTNFNISILVTDAFMSAVRHDQMWYLGHEVPPADVSNPQVVEREDVEGGKWYIYKEIRARELWELITKATYEYSEPGVIFIDRINHWNNLKYCEQISCTNPCGEQPLPPNGTCNLGAVNLSRMIRNPFKPGRTMDWELLYDTVAVGVRFLDNVIDVTQYPLRAQKEEELAKRRLGLGISGLANALAMLGLRYGNDDAAAVTRNIMRDIAITAYRTSIDLAKERGPFPMFNKDEYLKTPFVQKLPEDVQQGISEHGIRNGVLLTIAPTGTTSIYYGNVSSGIEPVFSYSYKRKVLQPDDTHKEYDVYDYGYLTYLKVMGETPDEVTASVLLPEYMVAAKHLTAAEHIKMQAAGQEWIDASVSKTVNCPEEMTYEEFKAVYDLAYDLDCKGCTTYRPSHVRGAILSTGEEAKVESELAKRPDVLTGHTYKINWPSLNSAVYVTINEDEQGRPFEMFVATKSGMYAEWMTALTLMITSIMRMTDDITFVPQELQQVVSSHDSAWMDGKFYGSLVAKIGDVLERHLINKGLIEAPRVVPQLTMGNTGSDVADLHRIGETCPKCASPTLIYKEGCKTCFTCGYSDCG